MSLAELIFAEVRPMSDDLAQEVLDFVGYLKTKHTEQLSDSTFDMGETCKPFHQPMLKDVNVPTSRPVGHRPKVGTLTSAFVKSTADAFSPMTDEELVSWGLGR